jgi:hypothetical protein
MVRRLIRDSLLKGMPGRGHRHTVKINESGRRVSVKNPNEATYRDFPHLAHWHPADWEEVNALLDRRNKGMGRKPVTVMVEGGWLIWVPVVPALTVVALIARRLG